MGATVSSFTKLTYHVVYGTRYRRRVISDALQERLYEYIGGIIREKKGHLIEIGGVDDHVHLLSNFPPAIAVSDMIRDVKANSAKWVNELGLIEGRFEWQKAYGAFTVSYSQIEAVRQYVRNQKEHHRERSFKDEYVALLRRHGISFEPRYLFEAEHHG